jgi:hypothetical protein
MERILAEIEKDPSVFVTRRSEGREGGTSPKKLDMRERMSTFEEVEAVSRSRVRSSSRVVACDAITLCS